MRAKASHPIRQGGGKFTQAVTANNFLFKDKFEEQDFKRDVNNYTDMRIKQERPTDKDKSMVQIKCEVYSNIYDYWTRTRNSDMVFDFPITDLV